MFQRDYIIRMIEQAAQAIARVLRLLIAKQPEQAAAQVDAAYAGLSIDRELLLLLDPATLRSHLADPDKLTMAARLLVVDAEVECARGELRAALRRLKAARRLIEAEITGDSPAHVEVRAELARVSELIARAQ